MSPQKLFRTVIVACRHHFPDAQNVRIETGGKHPKLCATIAGSTIRLPISNTPRVPDDAATYAVQQLRRQLGAMS